MSDKEQNLLMDNVRAICKQYDGKPEVVFVKGKMGSGLARKEALIMMVGPRLTLESLAKLRKEVLDCFQAKEEQLRNDPGGSVAFKMI